MHSSELACFAGIILFYSFCFHLSFSCILRAITPNNFQHWKIFSELSIECSIIVTFYSLQTFAAMISSEFKAAELLHR